MIITWDDLKTIVSDHKHDNHKYIYRGQSNSEWVLASSLLRLNVVQKHEDFVDYFEKILPILEEHIEAWTGNSADLTNPFKIAQFLSLIQHNGFPTPLLDWSFSPYVAAYFAFEEINHFKPQNDYVAIYAFNQKDWMAKLGGNPDYRKTEPCVEIIKPKFVGNHKQMLQQSTFMFSNVYNIEGHIKHNEDSQEQYLTKYEISVKERPAVLKDLTLMGVTAMQLAPCLESVCKKVYHDICANFSTGPIPGDLKKTPLPQLPFKVGALKSRKK